MANLSVAQLVSHRLFPVFWIVKRLPQRRPRCFHQKVAKKRATPVVS
jgi:hypothetical protein